MDDSDSNSRVLERERPCTCGNHVNDDGNSVPRRPMHTHMNNHDYQNYPLDSSFVHLPAPPPSSLSSTTSTSSSSLSSGKWNGPHSYKNNNNTIDDNDNDIVLFNHGFLSTHEYMSTLLKVTTDCLNYGTGHGCDTDVNVNVNVNNCNSGDTYTVCLCPNCIQRINNAIHENTEQMEIETEAYIHAVEEEKDKERRFKKALSINAGIHNQNHEHKHSHNDEQEHEQEHELELVQSTIQSFQQEIKSLETACQEHEQQLTQFNQLMDDQAQISSTLSLQEEALLLEYNILERDAIAFQDIHRQLAQQCYAVERERLNLSHVRLHSTLFDMFVDDKGLRYPLINNLRLAHRPSSKNGNVMNLNHDLTWMEINSAWSQATQLLMFLSSSLKFTSKNFGIFPLNCAKIIEVDSAGKKMYHHLGVDIDVGIESIDIDHKTHHTDHIIPSLRVFYRLLYQLFDHVKGMKGAKVDVRSVPFEMSYHGVGTFHLERMEDDDDKAWIGVINCIASNMKWLSYQL